MSEDRPRYRIVVMCEPPKEQTGGDRDKRMNVDVFEFAEANGLTFMEATVCKYISRHRFNNGLEDLLKAQHTINRMIQYYYPHYASKNQETAPGRDCAE